MLITEDQIQDIDKIYVLKECWAAPCGMGSNQRIIHNRWMVPITWVAEQCSMSAVQVLEEHLFASGLNVDSVGKMEFLKARANLLINGIALTITRCTFQEYKMRYNINSDEFDDLDKGYECVYSPYHIIFIPDIMAIDMFDL